MGRLKFVICSLALLVTTSVFALTQSAKVYSIKPEVKSVSGATMVSFMVMVKFAYNADELRKSGDSSTKEYAVKLQFKAAGNWVMANRGYASLSTHENILSLSSSLPLSVSSLSQTAILSVPLAAFNLPEGQNKLTPLITITDKTTGDIVYYSDTLPSLVITQQPLIKVKVWVKEIEVDTFDNRGELWDYFFLKPWDSNPDINWRLKCGSTALFHSEYLKNTFVYTDPYQQDTITITICRYDKPIISVVDVDELTPNDPIGSLSINPADEAFKNGALVTKRTGKVRKITFSVEQLP